MTRLFAPLFLGLACAFLAAQSTVSSVGPKVPADATQGPVNDKCDNPPVVRKLLDPTGFNAIDAISAIGLPFLGNDELIVKLDDPLNACQMTPGTLTWVLAADEPIINLLVPEAGCAPGDPGVLYVNVFDPSFHFQGPVVWGGPGMPACHTLVVPPDPSMCGLQCVVQGLFLDWEGPSAPFVLTEPLRFIIGS